MSFPLPPIFVKGESSSPKSDYQDLKKAVHDSKGELSNVQKAVKKMADRGNKFFSDWEQSLDSMDEIKQVSSAELNHDLWRPYDKIADDATQSETELHAVFVDLEKMVDAIDGDLDASSLAAHQDAVEELSARASGWLKDIADRHEEAKKQLETLKEEY